MRTILKNVQIVNEGKILDQDLLISGERIEKIADSINSTNANSIDCTGLFLFPGIIDSHVHFREPGYTHKACIKSESRAAVAGGVTSFMDMPNTNPTTTSLEALEQKYRIASNDSIANYSFYFGVTSENIDLCPKIDKEWVCGVTDDGLYFNKLDLLCNQPEALEKLMSVYEGFLSLHCEKEKVINSNLIDFRSQFGDDIPFKFHSFIRNEKACVDATKSVLEIQKRNKNRLHILHVSTKKEVELINKAKIENEGLTLETCPHYLHFSNDDYETLKWKIKWNPAIKSTLDKDYLIHSIQSGSVDFIASDHAPHLENEKRNSYVNSLSGGPIVQHTLQVLIELFINQKLDLTRIAEITSHRVAEIFQIVDRGFVREGYYADLVIVDLNKSSMVDKKSILSKPNWSPLENYNFQSSIVKTFVNGNLVFNNGSIIDNQRGKRIQFKRGK